MIRKSFTYKKIKTIVKCHCRRKVGRAYGSRFKAYLSIQIPYHRLPFWYDFEYYIFPLKKHRLVSIRLSPLFLVNLHKNTLTNLGWLVQDILPTSINWDAIHLYSRDEWFGFFMMPLPSLHICVSRDFFWRILRFKAARITFQIKMGLARYIYCLLMFSEI